VAISDDHYMILNADPSEAVSGKKLIFVAGEAKLSRSPVAFWWTCGGGFVAFWWT
jgi:hypothetical protein